MDASSVEAQTVADHFLPSCSGSRLESLEKGAIVDVVGKLLEIDEPRTVNSAGVSDEVANGRILGPDKVAIPVGFWGPHAKTAKEMEGKVICVYGCYVSVSVRDNKKSVNLRGKGSGRIVSAPPSIKEQCSDFVAGDIAREAIPSFERTSKPLDLNTPGFRTSLEYLSACSKQDSARLLNDGIAPDVCEVTWEIKGVILQVDQNKFFNNDQELWVRLLVTDHTSQKDLQATTEVLLSLTGASDLAELETQAKNASMAACLYLPLIVFTSLFVPLLHFWSIETLLIPFGVPKHP